MSEPENIRVTRPVLRYLGGKWRLAPWIIEHLPPHRVYVEPFGGGASVLLRKPRAYSEVYNDLESEVVNLFRVLRDEEQARQLTTAIDLTPFAREEFDLAYERSDDPVERARRMVVRSLMGHGNISARIDRSTGFRSNSNRSGTTPAHDWRNYPDKLIPIIQRLRGVVIENAPAITVMARHDGPQTLHYVDPPYVHETRGASGGGKAGGAVPPSAGYAHELSNDQHVALLEALQGLQGMVVLSGYPTPLYDDALRGWQRIEREARADGARARTEVLWINPAAVRQADLFTRGAA